MSNSIKKRIIGLLVTTGLLIQVQPAAALYSPTISRNVAKIRSHMLSSQTVNGTGDLLEAINSIKVYNRLKREGGYESGVPGEARVAQELIINENYDQVIQHPLDSLFMVFNFNGYNDQWISNCLRNEIWGLESLRDQVGQEMVRAYLLYDPEHGALLKQDYQYLIAELDRLRKYGADPNAALSIKNTDGKVQSLTSNEYFFGNLEKGENTVNMYTRKFFNSDQTGCPDGEFEQTFEQVVRSYKTLKMLSSGRGSSDGSNWGSIWEMAQANAKIKARQWIQANQITLTLGKEEGARINSLVKGDGWNRFVGNLESEVKIIENIAGSFTPLFDKKLWLTDGTNKSECVYYVPEEHQYVDCQEFQIEQLKQCKADEKKAFDEGINCDRFKDLSESETLLSQANDQLNVIDRNEQAKEEARTAFIYSITLDDVAEQAIYEMDMHLTMMNASIKQGYEGFGQQAGPSLPSLINEVSWVTQNQCINKQ